MFSGAAEFIPGAGGAPRANPFAPVRALPVQSQPPSRRVLFASPISSNEPRALAPTKRPPALRKTAQPLAPTIKVCDTAPTGATIREERRILQGVRTGKYEEYDPEKPALTAARTPAIRDCDTIIVKKLRVAPVIVTLNDEPWPEKTAEHCRYDHEPFDGRPFGIPKRYNERLDMYLAWGYFCSPSCALAMISQTSSHTMRNHEAMWVRAIAKSLYGTAIVYPARDLSLLAKFGGKMGIDEWRAPYASTPRVCSFPFIRCSDVATETVITTYDIHLADIAREKHSIHDRIDVKRARAPRQPRGPAASSSGGATNVGDAVPALKRKRLKRRHNILTLIQKSTATAAATSATASAAASTSASKTPP